MRYLSIYFLLIFYTFFSSSPPLSLSLSFFLSFFFCGSRFAVTIRKKWFISYCWTAKSDDRPAKTTLSWWFGPSAMSRWTRRKKGSILWKSTDQEQPSINCRRDPPSSLDVKFISKRSISDPTTRLQKKKIIKKSNNNNKMNKNMSC